MQEGQFERWLLDIRGLSHRTVDSRLSNCRRLETYEGDLDDHFDRDRLEDLIARLAYSTNDERHNAPPQHGVPIDGDSRTVRTVSANLKSAATLYKDFREGRRAEARRREPSPLADGKPGVFERVLRMSQPLPEHVQPASAASATFDLAEVIAAGESDRVEFKSSLRTNLHTGKKDPEMQRAVVKAITGFLNTRGGTLIVGVRDDGAPVGIDVDGFASEDKMNLHLAELVNNKIGKHAWGSIRTWFDDHQGCRVLVVQCEKSTAPVYVKEGEKFYIRTGNATNALSVKEGLEYISANFPR